jgi:hypothetical protein
MQSPHTMCAAEKRILTKGRDSMPNHPLARKAALAKLDEQIAQSRIQLKTAFDRYPPPPRIDRTLRSATLASGVSGYAALSSLSVRRFAAQSLIDLMLQQHDQLKTDASVRTFFMTASYDAGICFEDAPAVDQAGIKLSVRRVLQKLNLQAICAFEVDVMAKKLPGEHSRRLLFHVHAICWTRDASFQPVVAAGKLSDSPYFANLLGAPSFTFLSRKMAASRRINSERDPRFAKLERDQIARSIAWMCQYLLKPPLFAKHRLEQEDGRVVMRPDAGAFRMKTVLRMAEIWSKISVNQSVFAIGLDADKLVRALKRRVAQFTRDNGSAKNRGLAEVEISRAWALLFAAHPKLGYQTTVIKHRRS